ncbi:MAG: ATP-binding protein [Candidatus Omnitrophota bacterium]
MIAPNPFTPQSGWEPKVFGGREEMLRRFEETLREAREVRPHHAVILGDWGIGKTSLLKQFKKLAQKEGYPASFCAIHKLSEKSHLEEGIALLMEEILLGFPKVPEGKQFFPSGSKKLVHQPQVALVQFLRDLWGSLQTELALVLLDDIQNFEVIPQVVDVLRGALSHDEILEKTRYLFVLATTPTGWESFLDKHDPVGRFFRKREWLKSLTREEARCLIGGTLAGSGVTFEEEILEKLFAATEGHPYEIQLLSSHLYDAQIEGNVTTASWEGAFERTLRELGQDYFHALLRRASDRESEILKVLAEKKTPMSIADLRRMMIFEKRKRNFPVDNIKNFLYRLEHKGLVRRKDDAYAILDPMVGEFILRFIP